MEKKRRLSVMEEAKKESKVEGVEEISEVHPLNETGS